MRHHDRAQTPSLFRRLIGEFALGRLSRRIEMLKEENGALADRVAELERTVAHQGGQLKTLLDLVPRAMGRQTDGTEASRGEASDGPKTLH